MGRGTWTSVGIGATSVVAFTAVLTGLAAPSGGPLGRVLTPPAAAEELTSFGDCEELRRWYVAAALPHVGPWGLGGGPWIANVRDLGLTGEPLPSTAEGDVVQVTGGVDPRSAVPEASLADAVDNGTTGTNVQEAGVDEPDLAKTDGRTVYHLEGRRLVVTDVSGDRPRELATLRLPAGPSGGFSGGELLLVDDRLVVVAAGGMPWGPVPVDVRIASFPGPAPAESRLLVVDVSDPEHPSVEHESTYDGQLLTARQHGDTVRLVLSTSTPAIDFVVPRRGRSLAEARRENRRLVRESRIEDWLPTVRGGGEAVDGPGDALVACEDVRHPEKESGYGTMTVVGLDPEDPAERRTTAVTTSSDLVYASADRLYLATTYDRRSGVHAFALDGLDTHYRASGILPGHVRDRWSLSEHEGRLRVAVALGKDSWNPRENGIVVLEERGGALAEVGRVEGMGVGEQIQSVRWFGDLAVVVTFRQVDPLYTVDLSDPGRPRVVGELKIPGFSAYLHPVGDDRLLGLGQDATRRGETLGAQAAVFDLQDLADPVRLSTVQFRRWTRFTAEHDPRGFTFLPDRDVALAAMSGGNGRSRLVTLAVREDGSLTRTGSRVLPGWDGYGVRALPLADGRVAVLADGTVEVIAP